MTFPIRRKPIGLAVFLVAMLAARCAGAVDSGTPGRSDAAPPPAGDRMAPPEIIVKPVVPNKAELPDSAFKKLDAANKGYVTIQDTAGLDGFDKIFHTVDTEHTGRLDFAQFKKAWSLYSGYGDSH